MDQKNLAENILYEGEIIDIIQEAINVKLFKIKISENFVYLPGQFIKLYFDEGEIIKYAKERLEKNEISKEIFERICARAKKTFREYSITNYPGDNYIEILVERNNEGGFSPFFYDKATIGYKVKFSGAFGKFVINENDEKILFLAAGSGISPIICHIRYLFRINKSGKFVLLYSNKTFQHISFKKELDFIQSKFSCFKVYYTLTRLNEEEKKSWTGYSRRIDKEMIKEVLETNGINSEDTKFYVCGGGEFIKSMISEIRSLGFKRENIRMEVY
ncbi:MAG: FAD-binding oxidoreductase [Candidatus Aenigmatarchaeota archaeon]